MIFPRFNSRSTVRVVLFTLALLLSACGPEFTRTEPTDLFWPPPPETPRISYIRSIYTEDDIGRVYSLREKLFGKEYFDALERPYGVFAHRDKLYVADLILRNVDVFDFTAHRLLMLKGRGVLQQPAGAVADEAGTIYVCDVAGSKVAVFDASGTYRTAYKLENSRPVAIAIDEGRKRLYVVDRSRHNVRVLGLDGKRLFEFGGHGVDDGKFNYPLSIAVDRGGKLYVLDSGNFRVQIFDSSGKFLSKFGEVGDRPGQFANPKGIAVDSDGHIYVTDAAFSNFQIFDQQGRILLFVGSLGPMPGQFHLPSGIAIDENDRIYVADQLNRRVEVFQYLKSPAEAPPSAP